MLAELATVKESYIAKKYELQDLINRAKNPDLLNGATDETAYVLRTELENAENLIDNDSDLSQEAIEKAIQDLQSAIDGLKQKQPPVAEAEKPKEQAKDSEKSPIKAPSTGVARNQNPILAISAGVLTVLSLPLVILGKKRK